MFLINLIVVRIHLFLIYIFDRLIPKQKKIFRSVAQAKKMDFFPKKPLKYQKFRTQSRDINFLMTLTLKFF
jgi:hypothetical protein